LDHEVTETVDLHGAAQGSRTLSVVGAGRAGTALAVAAAARGWTVRAVSSRDPERARALADAVGARVARVPAEATRAASLTLLTVPDAQLSRVAATIAAAGLALPGRVVAHCSAGRGPEVLGAVRQSGAACGVLHPLQALAGRQSADLLEGSTFNIAGDNGALELLRQFVGDLGGAILEVPAASRALYHAAAVLAGNAPLALLERATSLLIEAGIPHDAAHAALAALLEGAARNARKAGPRRALTGPIARNDADTVRRHLDALADDPDARDLYLRMAYETLALAGRHGHEETAAVLESAAASTGEAEMSTMVA
jgi:predicted short-subunit dehydrogenase-like oxidoreductase (DUF2520 family)